jgi:hypothetical protein
MSMNADIGVTKDNDNLACEFHTTLKKQLLSYERIIDYWTWKSFQTSCF